MRTRQALLSLSIVVALCPGVSAADERSRGERAYHGDVAGEAIVANGRVRVPAGRFPCASCHGPDALGGREGSTEAPPIRWDTLSSATVTRPGYDEASFARVLVDGTDPAGRTLSQAMPRYVLEPSVVAALVSHLGAATLSRPPGLGPTRLDIVASGNASLDRGVAEVFAEDGTSVYGRRFALVVGGPGAFSLRELDVAFGRVIGERVAERLLTRVIGDDVSRVRVVGEDAGRLRERLEIAGIDVDPDADTAIVIGPGDLDGVRRAYGAVGDLAPLLARTPRTGLEEVVVVHLGEADVRRALALGENGDYLRGRALGHALLGAAIESGRRLTPEGLRAALERAPGELTVLDLAVPPR